MKVRATQKGYYGVERFPNDEFDITDKVHFSSAWMELVEVPKKPEPKAKAEPKQ